MVIVVVVAVTAGYLAGGRLDRLADLRFRGSWLLLVTLAFVPLGFGGGGRAGTVATVAAGLLLLAFLIANVAAQRGGVRAAFALMAAGWLLNLTVITANGAMPTPARVLAGPEWWPNVWLAPHLAEHAPIDSTTRLVWLADSIELRLPHVLVPVSAGDLLLFAGVIALVVTAMRRRVGAEGAGPRSRNAPVASRQEGRDLEPTLPRHEAATRGRNPQDRWFGKPNHCRSGGISRAISARKS
jgi:Family of unknown function (DUF5317)